jgi:hypothetical protein
LRILTRAFSFGEVDIGVKSLKLQKISGVDKMQNEHPRYAGQQFLI